MAPNGLWGMWRAVNPDVLSPAGEWLHPSDFQRGGNPRVSRTTSMPTRGRETSPPPQAEKLILLQRYPGIRASPTIWFAAASAHLSSP